MTCLRRIVMPALSTSSASPIENSGSFLQTLDDHFPSWDLIEIFGPPGAGKTYLCEQLAATPGILTTANHRGLRYYADRTQWHATSVLLPYLGRKLAKNYYGLKSRVLENEVFDLCGRAERDFLTRAITLVETAEMPSRTCGKISRSLRRSTALAIYCREEGLRLALDEGFLRRLVDIYWRMKAASAPLKHFDLMKACVEQFPFERNALAITAPPDICVARQGLRRQIIASPEKPQIVFHDATEAVAAICKDAGWRTLALDNR